MIGYYKTKFRTIGLLSPRKAAESALRLFCTPYTGRPKKKIPPVFHKALTLAFEFEGLTVRGFHWKPAQPGRKVLISHGFSSYSYKFEHLVQPLLREGFEVFAFDAPAHGTSDGKTINAMVYKNMLLRIEETYGPFYGFIGHSLGALATSLAMEEIKDNLHKKMVLIAPATETSRAIRQYCHLLHIRETTKAELEQLIESMTRKPISHFSVNRAVKQVPTPTLWVHDQHDRICPLKDTLPSREHPIPHLHFMITEGLGHNKIYRDQQVVKEILRFLLD
jgi:pimeloyl-ACP methyl ester carboxylesterase